MGRRISKELRDKVKNYIASKCYVEKDGVFTTNITKLAEVFGVKPGRIRNILISLRRSSVISMERISKAKGFEFRYLVEEVPTIPTEFLVRDDKTIDELLSSILLYRARLRILEKELEEYRVIKQYGEYQTLPDGTEAIIIRRPKGLKYAVDNNLLVEVLVRHRPTVEPTENPAQSE